MPPTPSPAARRRRWPRLLLLLLSAAVTLLVLEGAFRVRAWWMNRRTLLAALEHPPPVPKDRPATLGEIIQLSPDDRIAYELRPGLTEVDFKDGRLSTNSRGFRSPEYPAKPGPRTVTLVGIGDSVMFGHGVSDGETYMDRLGARLRRSYPDVDWRIVNTAVPGYNATMEVAVLETKTLDLAPKLVIHGLVSNDYAPPNYVRAEDDPLDPTRCFLFEYVWDRLHGEEPGSWHRRTVEGYGADVNPGLTYRKKWCAATERDVTHAPARYAGLFGKGAFLHALDRLAALSRAHGFRVLTLLMYNRKTAPEMLQACKERGFLTLDMQPYIERYIEEKTGGPFTWEKYLHSDLAVSPRNGHPSAKLHDLAAEKIFRFLKEQGLLEALAQGR